MNYEDIRKQVLEAALQANKMGLIHGTSGNISVRDPKYNVVAITPSGIPYDQMTTEDIAIVDVNGKWLEGNFKPSSETPMHTTVYRARPDVNAVVHTHSLYATVMGMSCDVLPVSTPPGAEMYPVRTVPFVMPGSQDLADTVVKALGNDVAVLMKNHGQLAVGKNLKKAMGVAEYVEEGSQIAYLGKLLGTYEAIPDDVVKAFREMIAAGNAV